MELASLTRTLAMASPKAEQQEPTIVPVASLSVMTAPEAFDSVTVNLSSPSPWSSSSSSTATVVVRSPAWRVNVPLAFL